MSAPKPPEGYETWLDWAIATMATPVPALDDLAAHDRACRTAARAELAALRADRDAWRTATGLANLTPDEAGERIDEVFELEREAERLREALERHDGGCVVSRTWNEEQDMKKRGVQCKCLGCQTRAALRRDPPTGGGEARE